MMLNENIIEEVVLTKQSELVEFINKEADFTADSSDEEISDHFEQLAQENADRIRREQLEIQEEDSNINRALKDFAEDNLEIFGGFMLKKIFEPGFIVPKLTVEEKRAQAMCSEYLLLLDPDFEKALFAYMYWVARQIEPKRSSGKNKKAISYNLIHIYFLEYLEIYGFNIEFRGGKTNNLKEFMRHPNRCHHKNLSYNMNYTLIQMAEVVGISGAHMHILKSWFGTNIEEIKRKSGGEKKRYFISERSYDLGYNEE